MSLLQGPVVFIDDELLDPATPAYNLAQQIKESGRPLAQYTELPPDDHSAQWRSIAFLVLDWDLVPGSPGALGGSTLSDFARGNLFEWLEGFVDRIFCPVFIVSAEDVDDIKRQLGGNESLRRVVDTGRMAVFPKRSLMSNFVDYLEKWVSGSPALTALNIWANEYELATNRLFQDMEKLAPDWPNYVWRSASTDGIDPSFELASVISANLLHRINPLQFDTPAIREFSTAPTSAAMRRVSQGRTALPADRLYPSMVLPGDIFAGEDEGEVWINVTPACHTVLNRPSAPGEEAEPESVVLHLVKGTRLEVPSSRSAFSNQKKQYDGPNGMLVHTMFGDQPFAFDFKARRIASWGDVSGRRMGRLLPPFITLLQQRHAAFLMNEGLPRVDWELYST